MLFFAYIDFSLHRKDDFVNSGLYFDFTNSFINDKMWTGMDLHKRTNPYQSGFHDWS